MKGALLWLPVSAGGFRACGRFVRWKVYSRTRFSTREIESFQSEVISEHPLGEKFLFVRWRDKLSLRFMSRRCENTRDRQPRCVRPVSGKLGRNTNC